MDPAVAAINPGMLSKGCRMSEVSHVVLDENGSSPSRRNDPLVGSMSCLFSTTIKQRVGSGMTAGRRLSKTYWFVRQLTDFSFGVRPIDSRHIPIGEERVIDVDELLNRYVPEVERFEKDMLPAVRSYRYRPKGDDFSGFGYASNDIRMDEANMRSLFLLALEYVESGKRQQGKDLVHQLLRAESNFEGKDQFLFNEFGISLRKAGIYSAAVTCYRKALEYTRRDDHLYYNLARAHYEQGQWWDCMNALGRSFEFNPDLTVARWLVDLTVALSKDSALRIRYEKPPVPEGVARRAILLSEAVEVTHTPMDTPVLSEAASGRKRIWHG